jgi:hypothetical protein
MLRYDCLLPSLPAADDRRRDPPDLQRRHRSGGPRPASRKSSTGSRPRRRRSPGSSNRPRTSCSRSTASRPSTGPSCDRRTRSRGSTRRSAAARTSSGSTPTTGVDPPRRHAPGRAKRRVVSPTPLPLRPVHPPRPLSVRRIRTSSLEEHHQGGRRHPKRRLRPERPNDDHQLHHETRLDPGPPAGSDRAWLATFALAHRDPARPGGVLPATTVQTMTDEAPRHLFTAWFWPTAS